MAGVRCLLSILAWKGVHLPYHRCFGLIPSVYVRSCCSGVIINSKCPARKRRGQALTTEDIGGAGTAGSVD